MERDPDFAAQVQAAKDAALGRIEEEIMRRGVDGWDRPVYQQGRCVGTERCYDPNLLLAAARALAPERWANRDRLTVEGGVAGVLVVGPPAANLGEWAARHATSRVIDGEKAPPAAAEGELRAADR